MNARHFFLLLGAGVLGIFLFCGCSNQEQLSPGEVEEFWGMMEDGGLGEILMGEVQVLLPADISEWYLQNLGKVGPNTLGMVNVNGIYYWGDGIHVSKWGLYALIGGEWKFFNCVIAKLWTLDMRTALEDGYVSLGGLKWRPLLKVSERGIYVVPEQDIRYQKKQGKEGTIIYDYFALVLKGPALSDGEAFSRITLEIPVLTICGLCENWPIQLLTKGDGVEAYSWYRKFFANLEIFTTGLAKTTPLAP